MSRKTRWRLLWIILFVVVLTFEFVAIFSGCVECTISGNVWELLAVSWLLWVVMGAFLLWLTVHFLLPRVQDWWIRKPWR
jgi:hypothetical protein